MSLHPSRAGSGLRLYGARVMLRPLHVSDFPQWSEVRQRNEAWLVPWEPSRPVGAADITRSRSAFSARCSSRDRDRQHGLNYSFGLFVDGSFAGEINLNGVVRGAQQTGTIGYWIDQARAGHRYVAEGVVVEFRFAFEDLGLQRIEVCIVPRNRNSRRVMEVLGLREEGVAREFLEINGTREDHVRYAITASEWFARRDEFAARWLGDPSQR